MIAVVEGGKRGKEEWERGYLLEGGERGLLIYG